MLAADSTSVPVMPEWSGYAGEAFNLTERRPLVILSESDDAFVVEGFYHRGEFWKAVIPKSGVSEIIGQRLNFSKPIHPRDGDRRPRLFFLNHVQARLKMEPDRAVVLYPSAVAVSGEPVHRVTDFSYSVEAVGPFGRTWNLTDALLGNLAVVHRFLSTEDVTFERIMRDRMKIVQSPALPLEGEFRNTLLHEAIRESHRVGISSPYFMVRLPFTATNCTSEPLKLLDRVLRTPYPQRFFHRLPVHPRGYLKLRGLWKPGPAPPTLNEEMADWIASEEAKARRQVHLEKKKQLPKEVAVRTMSAWRNVSSLFKAMRRDSRSAPINKRQ